MIRKEINVRIFQHIDQSVQNTLTNSKSDRTHGLNVN